ncbi:glutamyl aminopeptidase-like isoform X2 [Odontomachus brunneus]|uniref:glutamyl aminopeptidase-like isoform X2 n=1 Tax=Odontomachus brunneus TaxID=486640 RepID=UPI0013F26E5A|nr:glutamyl aminopeptidase-like isoform X2 [Odontomachus brunneus]
MRSVVFLGVVLIFTVTVANENRIYSKKINCSSVSENLNISEVMPIKYDARIIVKPDQRILSGIMNILIDVKKSVWNISLCYALTPPAYDIFLLYATNVTIFDSFLKAELGRTRYKFSEFQYCDNKNLIILKFNEILSKGKYLLTLVYRSIINHNIQDIFYPTWSSRNQKWLLTNLYTPHAIRAFFPCWDDPRVKTTYNISVLFPADYTVLSTMSENYSFYVEPANIHFGIKLMQFKEFVSMPTHLIAFLIVGDITMDFDKRDIHYMWHKTDAGKRFTYLLEMADNATCYFVTHMKMNASSFSPKINHVVLPNSPMKSLGAPGLVVYRERDITFDEVLDFPCRDLDVITLVTYEMARQLFIWESNRLMELFVVKIIQPTLNSDMFLEKEPIISEAKNRNGIDGLLYPLLYHKKAFALIRMLSQIYCPEVFKEAIRKYVSERTKNIWSILEEAYPMRNMAHDTSDTIKEVMNTWLTKTHYAELFVERYYDKRRPMTYLSLYARINHNEWIIPVNYFTKMTYMSSNTLDVVWHDWCYLNSTLKAGYDDMQISINNFLIVNVEQSGYYRVNYDDRNWMLLATHMQKNNTPHIPPLTRAQLVNDAYYFTIGRNINTSIFVEVTKHLERDTDFIAWYPMFNILLDISPYFKFFESNYIKEHFSIILDRVLLTIGYEENSSDDPMRKSLRYLVRMWACKLNHPVCINTASHRLIDYYIDNLEGLNKLWIMTKEWILCDGSKLEHLDDWKIILNKSMIYNNTELLEYLSCTENTSIIIYYLNLMLRTDYFSRLEQSMGPIFRKIVRKHVRKSIVLHYVLNNYRAIVSRFPEDFPTSILISDMIMNVYSLNDLYIIREHTRKLFLSDAEVISHSSDLLQSNDELTLHRQRYLGKVQDKFEKFCQICE